jgi:hypothetical protein
MTLVDNQGFLADQASRHDLEIDNLVVLSPGYPMAIGVNGDEVGREEALCAWLAHLEGARAALSGDADEGAYRLHVRGTLRSEDDSVLVTVFATYDRENDAEKIQIIVTSLYQVPPAELLSLLKDGQSRTL